MIIFAVENRTIIKRSFNIWRILGVSLMVALLSTSLLFKDLHRLFDHCHEDVLHCLSDGEQHIHGEEYQFGDCFVCSFFFSPIDDITSEATPVFAYQIITPLPNIGVSSIFSNPALRWPDLRGPPVLAYSL